MKKIYLLVLINSLVTNLNAQTFQWTKREGGWAYDIGYGVTNDTSGNIYIAGKYELNPNFSDNILPCQGNHDIFVAKYAPDSKLTWVRSAGGYSGDYARAIACDGKNYIYVTGEIQGMGAIINFDGSPIKLNTLGNNDIFLAKYDLNGNLLWAKSAGGSKRDEGMGVTYDATGNVYVCGFFVDTINWGITSQIGWGLYDIFVAKYDADGNLKWVNKVGSVHNDEAKAIKCDAAGNLYVCGYFNDTVTFENQTVISKGKSDGFLAKYDPNGALDWVKTIGGDSADVAWSLALDNAGKIYVAGEFSSNANFGWTSLTASSKADIFVTCFDDSGNELWATSAGGEGVDRARGIGSDGTSLYITGQFGFSASFGSTTLQGVDLAEVFMAKLDNTGNFLWANAVGGPVDTLEKFGLEGGTAICAEPSGNIYATGAIIEGGIFGNTAINKYDGSDVYLTKIIDSVTASICKIPTGLFADSIKSVSAFLRWSSVDNVLSYSIQYRKTGTDLWTTVSATTNFIKISGLTSSTSYEFQVRTICSSNRNNYSAVFAFTTSPAGINALIPEGSQWKYLDNGTNQGTEWKEISFNDLSWKTGNAEFGYGDGDESTTVGFGSNAANRYITTYFRKTFTIDLLSNYSSFELKLLKDDGAIVYINGVEAIRANMPAGSISFSSLAPASIGGSEETSFTNYFIDPSKFVTGVNTIAVEVHQSYTGSPDLSFNLALKAISSIPPDCTIPSELNTDVKENSASLSWTAVSGATGYDVQYRSFGTTVWTTVHTSTNSTTITGLAISTRYEFQVRTVCSSSISNYSSINTFITSGAFISALIPTGSSWKFLDNGTNQGTEWREISFNDLLWKTGNAELGYGDGGENTIVGFGSNAANKYITTYFRKTYTIDLLSRYSSFDLKLLKDDGAIVYINGLEVIRSNMPGGTISFSSLATTSLGGADETAFTNYVIDPSKFVTGVNTIAVEVHQSYSGSPDLSFNLILTGNPSIIATCPIPADLNASVSVNSATLSWTAVPAAISYDVQYRHSGTANWTTTSASTNSLAITGLTASTSYEFQVRTVCSSTVSSYSSTYTFISSGGGISGLIPKGSSWKYLDNGTNQGTAWKEISFNDLTWKTGNAELGYGDGDENTVIGFGPNAANRYITTYFRKTFTIDLISNYTSFDLKLLKDDGAIVYINGVEAIRSNMPTGTVSFSSLAPISIGGADETTFINYVIDPSKFVTGVNTIAVEVHQSYAGSPDVSFNLILNGNPSLAVSNLDLIQPGSPWKYLDDGTNQGTEWRTSLYNDSTWNSGNSELGYGDADESTVVSFGFSSTNKYITTYFRKTFNVTDISAISGLELSLIHDDGAVVYINGYEVYRTNLPAGNIYFNTLAPTVIDGMNESTYKIVNISSASLINGINQIAVEIHQNSQASSDISFNLKLKATTGFKKVETLPLVDNLPTNNIENSYDMIVSPNPTTGKFNLEFCIDNLHEKIVAIEVSNTLGQVVYKNQPKKINGCVKEVIELDASLPSGVYFLKVSIGDRIETKNMLLAR